MPFVTLPIPKDYKDPAMSANYCGIALASCFSKLLELYILMQFPDAFYTSDLQFSLVPRPFPPPVFDRLQYASKTGGGNGLGTRLLAVITLLLHGLGS